MENGQGPARMVNIADLTNPETGRTIRQENLKKQHNIPVDTLVEILGDENDEYSGMRLYINEHTRDCDGTPIYLLGSKTGESKLGLFAEDDLKKV